MTFYISNSGTGMLTWNITGDKSWITYSPNSGTTETEVDEIKVTIDRLGQNQGNHTGNITISSDGGNQTVTVSMNVPDEPLLSISPQTLDFGETNNSLTFDIANAGSGDLTWSIYDNQEWIAVNPTSGTNYNTINVTVDRNSLSSGSYSGTITVSSSGGTGYVSVQMAVPADEPPAAVTLSNPLNITENSIDITWSRNYNSDFAAYQIYYSTTPSVTQSSTLFTTITDNNQNSCTVTGLSANTTYYFRIYVMDTALQTTGSNVVYATTSAILGNWMLSENIEHVTFYSLWFNSENDGYAGGSEGKMYHWGGSNWIKVTMPEGSRNLYDIHFIDASNGYAVGYYGTFLYYNGISWSKLNSPTSSTINAVFPLATDNIWCISDDEIFHNDGKEWSSFHLDISTIKDIFFINENDGWVVDKYGKMFHYNGTGWSFYSDLENYNSGCGELYFLSSSEGWYINCHDYWKGPSENYIYHYDGNNWIRYENDLYPIYKVTSIQELSKSNVWAVGNDGLIFNFNGEHWNYITSPTKDDLYCIFMLSNSDGWAVGKNGVILRYH